MTTATAMTPGPELTTELVQMRHDLHRYPELGTQLPRTQAVVLAQLASMPELEITTGERQSSIIAVLRSTAAPPTDGSEREVILLRGDMDALPVEEDTGLPYSSLTPGRMHACGHDVHTSALYGAARLLHARRSELPCDVVFMFQPAEEASVGAMWMVEDGLLQAAGRPISAAFALHVESGKRKLGHFATRPGVLMAGCDDLIVTIHGVGGHGSTPHLTLDPVPVACEITLALQTHVNRRYSGFEPIVLTVGRINAGTDSVVIPASAEMELSVRTFSDETGDRAREEIPRLIKGIAEAHGLRASVSFRPTYPVAVNDPAETDYLLRVLRDRFGFESIEIMPEPLTGSEDFAWVMREVPGAYVMLGAGIPGMPPDSNHSPRATFDDSMIPVAAETLALLAWQRPTRQHLTTDESAAPQA